MANEKTMQPSDAPNTSVDDVLKETGMGAFIAKNKIMVITVVAVIIAGVFGWGVWKNSNDKKMIAYANAIHDFKLNTLEKFVKEKDAAAGKVVDDFKNIFAAQGGFAGSVTLGIEVSDQLKAKGADAQALEVLKLIKPKASGKLQSYILNIRLATLFEDANDVDMAINSLEELVKTNNLYFDGKVYLDLGRLYLKKGQKDMARKNFEYIIDKSKEAEFKKIARLYLSEL